MRSSIPTPRTASRIATADRLAPAALPNVARKPSPRVVHPPASEAIELRADEAVVFGEHLLPGGVSEPRRGEGRSTMSDMRRVVARRSCSPGTPSAPILPNTSTTTTGSSPTTQTSCPGGTFMTSPGLNSMSRRRPSRRGTARHHQLKMVELARGRSLDRLQGRRPAKARLEDAATHRHGAYVHQVDGSLGKSANVIRRVEALLDGSAGTSVAFEHTLAVLQPAASMASSGSRSDRCDRASSSRSTGRNHPPNAATSSGSP
jgi:hypothetical protein